MAVLMKSLNNYNVITWLVVVLMAGVALSQDPISSYEYKCYEEFGISIEPCFEYLGLGGDIPKECCQAVKSNVKVFSKRDQICDCIKDLSEGADEEQTDRFFGLPGKCVDDSRLKFNRHTNCSQLH